MKDSHTKGEMHGCIVCGRLYELYVVYDGDGRVVDFKVMSEGGHRVDGAPRPLVACNRHSAAEVERAVERVFGPLNPPYED